MRRCLSLLFSDNIFNITTKRIGRPKLVNVQIKSNCYSKIINYFKKPYKLILVIESMNNRLIILFLQFILLISLSNALSVDSITVDTVSPGEEGIIRINIENEGDKDVELLSFNLKFPDSGIIPLGSSEAFVNRLKEGDDEVFVFRFKVTNVLSTGTYSLGYTINYEEDNDERQQSGVIGIVVSAEPELEVVADTQNSIVGKQGILNIRIINKGLADARFVYLFVEGDDSITLLSENSEYIGTIDSDDFETSSFDVVYNNRFSIISTKLVYKDFNNNEQEIKNSVSLRAYTNEEAIEKGILKKSNAPIYVGIIVLLLVLWILYRFIRKKRKNKN